MIGWGRGYELRSDQDLRPERQTELEGGVDATLFNGRANLEATLYQKSIGDLLLTRTLPGTAGFSQLVFNGGNMRNLAIYGDKIFLATPDAHIVALNATTGKVAWDRTTADYKLGYAYTSGPIVVKGKVVAGIRGCDHFKVTGMTDVCFISALDAETGREVWRTSTVARPGEPGGDTWGDLPLIYRAGGDAWIPGSYDPQTNLIYWATAQPKPWGRVSRRLDGDALYTNTVLALDPDAVTVVTGAVPETTAARSG